MQNRLVRIAIELKEKCMLNDEEIKRLKIKFDAKEVDVVVACVSNDIVILKKYIENGYDLKICNDKVLRYTVSQGYVDISKFLLENGINP